MAAKCSSEKSCKPHIFKWKLKGLTLWGKCVQNEVSKMLDFLHQTANQDVNAKQDSWRKVKVLP